MSPAAEAPPDRLAAAGAAGGWLLLAVAVVAGLPALAEWPATGLDPSWKVAFHLCRERGLVVGRDTLYTYGPWGFLASPLVLVRSQWLASVAWLLGGHLALGAALAAWMRREVPPRLRWVAPLPLLLAPPPSEYELPLAVMLAAVLVTGARGRWPLGGVAIGVVAAAAMLVKTGPGLVAGWALLGAAGVAASRRAWAPAAALVGGWVVSLALMGSVALGSPAHLPGWVRDTVDVTAGYARALERGGPLWQPLLVLMAVGLAAVAATAARPAAVGASPLLVSVAGVMALAFRHAFTRQETHSGIAFTVGAAVVTWVALLLWGSGPGWSRWARSGAAAALLTAAVLAVPGTGLPRPIRAVSARVAEVTDALRHFRRPAAREEARQRLQELLPLGPEVLAELEGRTVDVLTHELSLVEAYDLAWRPRPVMQSYVACSVRLDRRDAEFLISDRAPERLLVEPFGLDTRDPLMDTPLTWRALALHWEPVARDHRWLVLQRRQVPRTATSRSLARYEVELNRPFHLPEAERGHVELTVDLEPTLAGRVVGALWKTPEVRLQALAPAPHPARRVVAATAVNPFPLPEPPVSTSADLELLLAEPAVDGPAIVRLVCRGPWAFRPASVEVFQVEWVEPDLREASLRPRL